MKTGRTIHPIVLMLGVILLVMTYASFQAGAAYPTFEFTKIADTDTPIPGGLTTFGSLTGGAFGIPAIDGGIVVFRGRHVPTGHDGIYKAQIGNALSIVADINTPVPGGGGTFLSFNSNVSNDSGNVSFTANRQLGGSGVYAEIESVLEVVADTDTTIPGESDNFSFFFPPDTWISNTSVTFVGGKTFPGGDLRGIYSNTCGPLSALIDTNTTVPGSSDVFVGFSSPPLDDQTAAYFGTFPGGGGLFITDCGKMTSFLAQINVTTIPGGTGTFQGNFTSVGLERPHVAFIGEGSMNQEGVYLVTIEGALTVLVDKNTSIPGGIGKFTDFEAISIHNGKVVFVANGSGGQRGLYLIEAGTLTKVINISDQLDGKSIQTLRIERQAFDGNNIAFQVTFIDPTDEGVYTVTRVTDSDGDGIPDDNDTCPNSDLSGSVIIDGCDSGVQNVFFDDGCTISDLISQCAEDADNHGEFVSAVSHLSNFLNKNGTISGKEKGMIQKCAAEADIP